MKKDFLQMKLFFQRVIEKLIIDEILLQKAEKIWSEN